MPHTDSILRYPGGKTQLKKFVEELISFNKIKDTIYVEPFAGGAGLALSLLLNGTAKKIVINDYDVSIWSVWNAVINHTSKLKEFIIHEDITIDNWIKHRQNYHELQKLTSESDIDLILQLAFSTLFLNRTNVSGVIKGGVIGGIEQKGAYKLDCRFNKKTLLKKIDKIADCSQNIELFNLDAVDFLKEVTNRYNQNQVLIFLDPPYFVKGPKLYSNFYTYEDHFLLSQLVQNKKFEHKWIVTYDDCKEIKQLYLKSKSYRYSLNYSLSTKKSASELMFFSESIKIYKKTKFIKDLEILDSI